MSNKTIQLLGMILLAGVTSLAYGQSNSIKTSIENEKLIEASQAGAMPLYFDVKSKQASLISPDLFSDSSEFKIRGGLPNFFQKIKNKQPVTLGYLGGSITRGDNMYRNQSAKYIQHMFPTVTMKGINAGVSGTGTELGACRVYDQLLKYKPDLVFVEFAVNGAYKDGMEGIIRQIWKFDPNIDICLIYTMGAEQIDTYNSGRIPQSVQGLEKLAEYYNIPSIHMGLYPAKLVKIGKVQWKFNADSSDKKITFSKDGLHPLEAGGNLYAGAIARAFQALNKHAIQPGSHVIKSVPITEDNWEDAKMIDPKSVATFSNGWRTISPLSDKNLSQFAGWFPYIFKGNTPGMSFEFTFIGKSFGFFDVGGPDVGQIEIELDGKKAKMLPTSLRRVSQIAFGNEGDDVSNRFNINCNNRYRGQFDMFSVTPGQHHVKISISSIKADKVKILGVTQSSDIKANPEKYDQTVFYLGKILLRGEILQAK